MGRVGVMRGKRDRRGEKGGESKKGFFFFGSLKIKKNFEREKKRFNSEILIHIHIWFRKE